MRLIRSFCVKIVKNTIMLIKQCAFMHVFRKHQGCALIGACALIRTNTVYLFSI